VNQSIYTRRQLLELEACTNCGLCVEACPAVTAAGDGRISPAARLETLRRIERRRKLPWSRWLGKKTPTSDELRTFGDSVFRCTLCGGCQEVCPIGLSLKDLWCSLRTDLVGHKAYPKKVDLMRDNLQREHNVFGEDSGERAEWVEDLQDPPEDGFIRDHAEVVYFVGCTASYFPLAQKIPTAVVEAFEVMDISFTLLGEEEWCCGFPMIGAGSSDLVRPLIEHNMEAIQSKGAKKAVFACPSCYQTWREYYPAEFEIQHVSEFMNEVFRMRPELIKPLDLKVTYHDPCDLGRGARVFEAPRQLIRSLPGIELVEMAGNRENCTCCGGGGNLEMVDPALSAAITGNKIKEILNTGAKTVVTSCQQCVRTLTTYVRRNKIPLDVLDVTQLVRQVLKR
jgi:heterodisulfide reductase subunit D